MKITKPKPASGKIVMTTKPKNNLEARGELAEWWKSADKLQLAQENLLNSRLSKD